MVALENREQMIDSDVGSWNAGVAERDGASEASYEMGCRPNSADGRAYSARLRFPAHKRLGSSLP